MRKRTAIPTHYRLSYPGPVVDLLIDLCSPMQLFHCLSLTAVCFMFFFWFLFFVFCLFFLLLPASVFLSHEKQKAPFLWYAFWSRDCSLSSSLRIVYDPDFEQTLSFKYNGGSILGATGSIMGMAIKRT